MNVIDIVLIIFILLIAFVSAKRGLLLALLNFCVVILSGIISRLCSGPLAGVIYNGWLHDKALAKLYDVMPSGSASGEINTAIDNVFSVFPESIVAIAKQFGFFPQIASENEFLTVEAIEERFVHPIVTGVVSIIATVVLFALFYAIFKVVAVFINKAVTNSKKHKLIHGSNAILGGAIGLIKGIIPAGIACVVLDLLAPISGGNLAEVVDSSCFCGLIAKILG